MHNWQLTNDNTGTMKGCTECLHNVKQLRMKSEREVVLPVVPITGAPFLRCIVTGRRRCK